MAFNHRGVANHFTPKAQNNCYAVIRFIVTRLVVAILYIIILYYTYVYIHRNNLQQTFIDKRLP